MKNIIDKFYTSLCYYGYSLEDTDNLYKALRIKYGNLSEDEFKEVLYNVMTSCIEEDDLSLDDRLIHIDGLWYASRKYAKFRCKIKGLSLDDMVKNMECALENEQGYFLTNE